MSELKWKVGGPIANHFVTQSSHASRNFVCNITSHSSTYQS